MLDKVNVVKSFTNFNHTCLFHSVKSYFVTLCDDAAAGEKKLGGTRAPQASGWYRKSRDDASSTLRFPLANRSRTSRFSRYSRTEPEGLDDHSLSVLVRSENPVVRSYWPTYSRLTGEGGTGENGRPRHPTPLTRLSNLATPGDYNSSPIIGERV